MVGGLGADVFGKVDVEITNGLLLGLPSLSLWFNEEADPAKRLAVGVLHPDSEGKPVLTECMELVAQLLP